MVPSWAEQVLLQLLMKQFDTKEFIIFVCTDSTEIFLSKLRSSCLNYNLPSFSLTLTVRGVSNKHCLLTFFIEFPFTVLSAAS